MIGFSMGGEGDWTDVPALCEELRGLTTLGHLTDEQRLRKRAIEDTLRNHDPRPAERAIDLVGRVIATLPCTCVPGSGLLCLACEAAGILRERVDSGPTRAGSRDL